MLSLLNRAGAGLPEISGKRHFAGNIALWYRDNREYQVTMYYLDLDDRRSWLACTSTIHFQFIF